MRSFLELGGRADSLCISQTDLVRALNLLMLFKPVQFATLYASGITDPSQAEQVSKLNGSSSATLYSLTIRVAFSTTLHAAPGNFTKIYSPGTAPPPAILSDLRLWLWLGIVDVHGGLTAGRALSLDMSESLRVTRMFAALNAQPGDTRLAATVELYGVARAAISTAWFKAGGTIPVPTYELKRCNREIDDWEAYWRPELVKAAKEGDNFAMSVLNTFANTVRIILNARWVLRPLTLLPLYDTNHSPSSPRLASSPAGATNARPPSLAAATVAPNSPTTIGHSFNSSPTRLRRSSFAFRSSRESKARWWTGRCSGRRGRRGSRGQG
jgi:hypothetical protein